MNVRKNADYSEMYETLDHLMAQELPQMELYCEIGKAVCRRTEKGAAVMASEHLNKRYPDVKGFSPRSLRRMRNFYRTYENHPSLLSRAMELGWIQNMVIMEAELTMELREWYMKAAKQFGWSKTELIANIAENAHENIVLAIENEVCYVVEKEEKQAAPRMEVPAVIKTIIPKAIRRVRKRWLIWKKGRRRCVIMSLIMWKKDAIELEDKGEHLKILHAPGFVNIDCGCGYDMPIKALACLRLEDLQEFYV